MKSDLSFEVSDLKLFGMHLASEFVVNTFEPRVMGKTGTEPYIRELLPIKELFKEGVTESKVSGLLFKPKYWPTGIYAAIPSFVYLLKWHEPKVGQNLLYSLTPIKFKTTFGETEASVYPGLSCGYEGIRVCLFPESHVWTSKDLFVNLQSEVLHFVYIAVYCSTCWQFKSKSEDVKSENSRIFAPDRYVPRDQASL